MHISLHCICMCISGATIAEDICIADYALAVVSLLVNCTDKYARYINTSTEEFTDPACMHNAMMACGFMFSVALVFQCYDSVL